MLINHDILADHLLKDERYAPSHGCNKTFFGFGMIYYALAYAMKAKCCVCLGSGSGFVPRIMRQAQLDLALPDSSTILIDANIVGCKWGQPDYFDDPNCYLRSAFDIKIHQETTAEAIKHFADHQINFLHVDADHSYEGVKTDFETYKNKLDQNGIMTFHDSVTDNVQQFITELRQMKEWELINIYIGMGTVIAKRINNKELKNG